MKPNQDQPADAAELRRRAEERLQTREPTPQSASDAQRLVHELEVHQIELEMQNEELRQAHARTEALMAQYAEFYDFAPVGHFILSEQGLILKANLPAAKLLRTPRGSLVKQPLSRFILPADRDIFCRHCEQRFEAGQPQWCELRLVRPAGASFWARLDSTAAQDDASGAPLRRVMMTDITERKQVEAALQESEERYRTVVEDLTEVICRFKADGTFTFVNAVFCRFFGKKRQELLGKNWHPSAMPEDVPMIEERLRTLCPANPVVVIENRVCSGSGEIRWMQFVNRGLFNAADQFVETQAVGRDTTERRRAEEALRRSEAELQATLEAVADGILAVDNDGEVIRVNWHFAELWRIPKSLLQTGCHPAMMDFMLGQLCDRDAFLKKVQSLYDSNTLDLDTLVFKDGRVFECFSAPMLLEGAISGRVWSFHDMTERKQAEEEREKMIRWQQGICVVQQSLLAPASLEDKLRHVTDSIVRLFGADFCRIWLTRPGDMCERGCVHAAMQEGPHVCRCRDRCLHLLASSGRYTHIDGKAHRRVPLGAYKIGRIASGEDHKFLTNDVTNDPRIHNHEWARALGLVSFAGYQLRIPDAETLGVLALFAKRPMLPAEDALLDGLSSALAQAIQQAQADEALRRSETKFRTLYDSTSDAVMLLDQKDFFDCNQATLKMFGCATREEFCAKHPADLSPPVQPDGADSLALANQGIATAMEKGSHHFEWLHKRADTGETFPAEVLLNAMELDGKRVLQATVRDITERKRAEKSVQMFSQEIITAREEERRRVASALHHDVGSLAVGVSAHLEAIEKDLRSGKPGEALKWMKRTRKLFDESVIRLKGVATQLRPPELDILGLCAALRQHFAQVTERGGIRIHFRETLGRRGVSGDAATILFRIAQEALTNALKHGHAKRVNVDLRASKKEVRLTVHDNGKGFDPSKQRERATSQMGLRVMREMAAAAGGAFAVDSEPGKGTTVCLSLPLK